MNSAAEALTGVKAEHAAGRHAHEILHLLDEQSGESLTPKLPAITDGPEI